MKKAFIDSNSALVKRAVEIKTAYKLSFWDSMIVSSAEYASCEIILSEDFNQRQLYAGIAIENPFSPL